MYVVYIYKDRCSYSELDLRHDLVVDERTWLTWRHISQPTPNGAYLYCTVNVTKDTNWVIMPFGGQRPYPLEHWLEGQWLGDHPHKNRQSPLQGLLAPIKDHTELCRRVEEINQFKIELGLLYNWPMGWDEDPNPYDAWRSMVDHIVNLRLRLLEPVA